MRRARKRGAVAQNRRVTAKINEQLGTEQVRLLAEDGSQLGIMNADEARAYAYAHELDLVEVAANADPPVGHTAAISTRSPSSSRSTATSSAAATSTSPHSAPTTVSSCC